MSSFWNLPLWAIAIVSLACMFAAHEIGVRIRTRRNAASKDGSGASDEAFIVSGVLGLLALLMAFSFSMSLNRFEERRDLMLAETSAVGNLAMMSQATTNPEGERIRAMLRSYAEGRLKVVMLPDGAVRAAAAVEANKLRAALSQAVAVAIRLQLGKPVSIALASAYDAVEDTAVRREALTAAHLPERVLWLLLVYSIVTAGMLGFVVAAVGSSGRGASSTFYLLLSLAFAVMLDLDRPRSGAITVSQQPFVDAVKALPNA